MMNATTPLAIPDEVLVAHLHRLGVTHLARLAPADAATDLEPADLLAALASHPQARFRSTLVLLFLRQPAFANAAPIALQRCSPEAGMRLRLFYQAAAYLQPTVAADLHRAAVATRPLPDLFSRELALPAPGEQPVAEALALLAQRHETLSGVHCNWVGTYRQHLPLFVRHLNRHADPDAA